MLYTYTYYFTIFPWIVFWCRIYHASAWAKTSQSLACRHKSVK